MKEGKYSGALKLKKEEGKKLERESRVGGKNDECQACLSLTATKKLTPQRHMNCYFAF